MNPFSRGSMGFDDYSYKFYNDAVLNPKAIAAINDDENIDVEKLKYVLLKRILRQSLKDDNISLIEQKYQ